MVTMKAVKKGERNSTIELLKVIGIILIVISHACPMYGEKDSIGFINIGLCTGSISNFILVIFRYSGQIGNAIFVVCSAWFLIESDKLKGEKICKLACNTFAISILFLITCAALKIHISKIEVVKSIFPIMFQNNWFITSYLLIYAMHPLLNIIIKNVNKVTLLKINIVLFILYCMINGTFIVYYYYTDLVKMIVVYFIVAYVKLYLCKFVKNRKLNILLFCLGSFGLIILIAFTNLMGVKFAFFYNKLLMWATLTNPFIILIAITLFNLFANTNVKISSRIINYISSLSLIVYLIHENILFASYIKPHIFIKWYFLVDIL